MIYGRHVRILAPHLLNFGNLLSNPITPNFTSSKFRYNSSIVRKSRKEKVVFMEDTRRQTSSSYNKKRAQGRDEKPQNLPLKVRKLNPINTISYIQILGTGMDTQDTSPSVLLFFDKQRFIFNAGEGLQRYCTAHKIKLSKIDHIFLSRVCSETAGGLPGLLLTLAGIGEQGMSVNLWGSSDLNYLIEAMQSFIRNAAMVHSHCFGPRQNLESFTEPLVLIDDKVVKISAILVRPDYTAVKPGDISVVYVCELPEIKGKFDPEKAASLGLRAGPKYRQLQSGNSVKSDQKNIMVHPNDVLGPAIPGPIVILVDCPTLPHLQKLYSIRSVSAYYGNKSVKCIVHLSPSSVTMTATYQDWMKKFHGVQHIMAGHETKNTKIPILKSSAKLAMRLNYLCPKFFPSPGFGYSTYDSLEDSVTCDCISAENLLKFQLRPYTEHPLDKSTVPSLLSSSAVIDELLSEIPEIADSAKQVSEICNRALAHECAVPSCLEDITREEMEVVLLGTGSSQPSKYRNVSSIYVNLFAKGGLLLDCGEGSLGQLKRRFGVKGADDAVRSLRCIWISHIHADHHAGLARILSLRRELLTGVFHEPLIVIGPKQLKRFLDAYQNIEDLDMQFLDCSHTTETRQSNNMSTDFQTEEKLRTVLEEAGLEAFVRIPVVHCPQAYGIVVKSAERTNNTGETVPGWKLVYSGDTRPCPELIEASHGATLLIHEATFEDSMVEEAIARNHSTTKEAIEVGESVGAYRIILTHFSQRYPKIPVFDEMHMQKTCIGFDLMSINLADLPVLPKVNPYFKLLFRNEMRDGEVDYFAGPLL